MSERNKQKWEIIKILKKKMIKKQGKKSDEMEMWSENPKM